MSTSRRQVSHKLRTGDVEQVGGTSHSRERVVGCSAVLSIVGKELSSLPASISPDASDRAVMMTAACHGVQCRADGIRVSDVSIVADGPISGEYSESVWQSCPLQQPHPLQTALSAGTSNKQSCQLQQPHPLQTALSAGTSNKQSGQLPQPRQLQTLFFRSSAERSQTLRAKAECALKAWPFLVAQKFVLGLSTPGISNFDEQACE